MERKGYRIVEFVRDVSGRYQMIDSAEAPEFRKRVSDEKRYGLGYRIAVQRAQDSLTQLAHEVEVNEGLRNLVASIRPCHQGKWSK